MYIKQPTKRLIVRQIDQSREANMLKQKKMLIAQFILSLSAMFFYIPKNIAGFLSEVLVLGVDNKNGGVSIISPDPEGIIGNKLY